MKTAATVLVEGIVFAACVLVIGAWCFGLLPAILGAR